MNHKLLAFFSALALSLCIGCSNHVGLSGTVVFSDNGEPVPSGEVQLATPTFLARATIKQDGSFVVGSYKEGDGIPPGTYSIAVHSYDSNENSLIDLKYADAGTSGLSIAIDKTTRSFKIEVDRPSDASLPEGRNTTAQ